MLIIGRRTGEAIVITASNGERITVMPTERTGGHIKLAIDAPESVTVDREEVHLRKQREAS